jgi:antibiotic biosynthesis monooxygenase (ABM) superfamily enzyme
MPANALHNEVSGPEPLTVVATWKVKSGKEAAFEELQRAFTRESAKFPGYLGVSVMRNPTPSGEYVVIYKFDCQDHLDAWQKSSVRQELLRKAEPLRADAVRYQIGNGLEFWFTSPASSAHPPRWKMAIITALGVWPVSILVPYVLKPYIVNTPQLLQALLIAMGIVILLTWLVMPVLVKIFRSWLENHSQGD